LHNQISSVSGAAALGLLLTLLGLAGAAYGLRVYPAFTVLWWGLVLFGIVFGSAMVWLLYRASKPSPLPVTTSTPPVLTAAGPQSETEEHKTRSLELLYDVAASINVSRDLDDLLARFINTLGEVLGAEAASIRLMDEEGHLQLCASFGADTTSFTGNVPDIGSERCVCSRVMREGHLRQPEDVKTCCRCCADVVTSFPQQRDLKLVVVPLQYRNHNFGVLAL